MPQPLMPKTLNWLVWWRHTRPSRTNTKRRYPFHHRGLESKSRKSRHTWRNKQVCPWSTKWSRAKANRVLPRERTSHSKHPLATTQEMTTHGHHQMVNTEIILIIFFAAEDGEALYSPQKQIYETLRLSLCSYFTDLIENKTKTWTFKAISEFILSLNL